MQVQDAKALEAEIKFPTTTILPTLELLRQKLTSGGLSLVLADSEKPTAYSYTVVFISIQHATQLDESLKITFVISRLKRPNCTPHVKSGAFTLAGDLSSCTFWFGANYRLLCSHVLYTASKIDGTLPPCGRWEALNTVPGVPLPL